MRNFLLAVFVLLSVCASAQVNNSFRGTLNVFSATGLAPNYRVTGFFSDANGYYSSDSCQVGDVIFAFYTTTCVRFVVDSIITKAGSIITADVIDVDSITAAFPFGVSAIMRETPTNGFPVNISGISGPLASCIETHFKGLVDVLRTGAGGSPGNSQDTIVQVAHGLSLLDPVFVNASGNWILSNISNEDSCHMAIVTEVISADTLILTYNGLTTQPAHGYTVGSVYFVQDDGTYATTVPTNFINDIAFYVVSDSTLYITEQRIVSPMTDLNGIYSSSDTIPSGTIATAGNFQFMGLNNNYYLSFNPENDIILMRGDSVLLGLGIDGAVLTDVNASKRGLEYAASGYVTQPLSLTTKEYVDSLVSSVEIPDGDKGDIVVSGSGTVWDIDTGVVGANELASTAVTPGSYGNSTNIPTITIDADGRITAAANTAVSTHDPVTVTDGTTIDLTLSTQNITAEVKPESIQASHIDTNAVTTSEIQDGTITTTDLAFTPITSTGTNNYVTYWTGASTQGADADFQFDGTNVAVGKAPIASNKFVVEGDGSTSSTNGIVHQNSSGNNTFTLRDDGTILARYLGRTPGAGTEGTTMLWSLNSNISDTIPSTTRYGLFNNIHYTFGNTVGNASSKISGIYSNANFSTSANGRLANIRAFEGVVSTSQSSQVLTGSMYGMELSFSNAITGLANNPETGGLYISGTNGGRIQNTYGIRIGDITSGTQDNQAYSLYTGDLSARNYFGGNNQLGDGGTINYVGIGYAPSSNAVTIIKGPNNSGGRPRLLIGNGTAPQIHSGTNDMSHAALHVYANWESDTQTPRTFTSLSGQTGILAIAQPVTQSCSQSIYGYLSNNGNISFNQYSYNTCGYFLVNHASRTVGMTNGVSAANRRDFEFVGVHSENTFSGGSVIVNDLSVAPNVNTWGGRFIAVAPTTSADPAAVNNVYGISVSATGNAINAYGLLVSASGSTTNWSIYSDEGQHWFEDEIRVGGTASTPTANIDIDGSTRFRAISTPGSVEDGETWTSSTQKALVSNQAGVTQAINGTLFTGTSTITVNNTAAETTLIPTGIGTVTLPANFWTVGKTLEITAYGDWRTDTVPSTLELRMELGGTLLCTTSAQTMVATEGAQWKATATVTCRSTGVSGTTMSEGELRMNSAAGTSVIYQMYRSTTNTIDTTTSAAFDITVTHGAADPFNEMKLHTLTIKVLN